MSLVVKEMPSEIWELKPTFSLQVDRSGLTVAEYLESRGIMWLFGKGPADVLLYKGDVGPITVHKVAREVQKRLFSKHPKVTLLGEPRELASAEYFFARQENTLAVAPGDNLNRLFFASLWLDPQLDGWGQRMDRLCWIGRPTPERIETALSFVERGVPLDIYSRTPWPLPNWKGFARDEVATSRKYKYRVVCENSLNYGYHSEKLFNSLRCGCVTFYSGDKALDLSHAAGTYCPLDVELIVNRKEIAPPVLSHIEKFMFSEAWETYSFKNFYDRLITLIRQAVK